MASLLPSATEIMSPSAQAPELAAVTHECDFTSEAGRLPRVTRHALDLDGAEPATVDRHIREARHSGSSIYALDTRRRAERGPD